MFYLLGWLIFGLVVGLIAKWLHPGDDPVGFLPTIGIGICGSLVGGAIQWVLSFGGPFTPAGLVWSVIGGVLFCYIYRRFRLNQYLQAQKKKDE